MIVGADEYVTFVPADPPRAGRFACWRPPARGTTRTADGLRVVVPFGRGTRAVEVPARYTPVADVIDPLLALPVDVDHAMLAPWADVVTFAVDLVARGRFHPGITASGLDTWRAGPLTPADERYCHGAGVGTAGRRLRAARRTTPGPARHHHAVARGARASCPGCRDRRLRAPRRRHRCSGPAPTPARSRTT